MRYNWVKKKVGIVQFAPKIKSFSNIFAVHIVFPIQTKSNFFKTYLPSKYYVASITIFM